MADKSENFTLLTAMRAFFAWWVVLYHVRHWLVGTPLSPLIPVMNLGFLGVDFFFVLSGFVIHHKYFDFFKILSLVALRKFYVLRLARIYPLHLAICIAFLLNPLAIKYFSNAGIGSDRYELGYFFMSLALIQNWGLTDSLKWNGPAWSISTEAFAYLMYPMLGYFLLRTKKFWIPAFCAFAIIPLVLHWTASAMSLQSIGENISKFGIIRCALEFTIGCCVSATFRTLGPRNFLIKVTPIVCIGIIGLVNHKCDLRDYSTVPICVALLIFSIALWHKQLAFLSPRPLIWLGEISYATYLVHYFVKDWFGFLNIEPRVGAMATLVGYCVTVLILSGILHRMIEVPMQFKVKNYLWPRARGGTLP